MFLPNRNTRESSSMVCSRRGRDQEVGPRAQSLCRQAWPQRGWLEPWGKSKQGRGGEDAGAQKEKAGPGRWLHESKTGESTLKNESENGGEEVKMRASVTLTEERKLSLAGPESEKAGEGLPPSL